jgi:homocysteine S-methyltransferase
VPGITKPFLEALADAPLLVDGAMGSFLYDRGVMYTRSFDELNLSQPELISQVHHAYLDAGADIVETNTFGANRIALAKHGHAERAVAINEAAVRIARGAVGTRAAWVAGAVGPTGIDFGAAGEREHEHAQAAFAEQIGALADAGVDLLILETFSSVEEIELALGVARGRGLPVLAQVVFGPNGRTAAGLAPAIVATRLVKAGADAVGANCGLAMPDELLEIGTAMLGAGVPVSLQPNAGLPRVVDGRTIYVANPEHFGVWARRALKAGVRIVGGCCGTTPEHTRRMLGAVRMIGARPLATSTRASSEPITRAEPRPVAPIGERSVLGAKLAAKKFAVSCELSSPSGTDAAKTIAAAKKLKAAGVDVVNIADGPRATARMGNLALCDVLQREAGVEAILHVCCRDRNLLGLVAHLLAAHALGLRDLVIITGDPPKIGDYPFATPVYDLDSIGLLQLAADLNRGVDPGGKPMNGATSFVLATGAEPGALDYERELRRLEQKVEAGAELIMTQPVYDGRLVERFLDDTKGLGTPVMIGLLPLASHRNAEFLHNEVPGMRIPDEIRARMARVDKGPAAQAEGVKIAQEALAAVKDRVAGAYIMPPFDRVDAALEILKIL